MKLSTKQYAEILDKALAEAGSEHAGAVYKDFAKLLVREGKTSRLSDVIAFWKKLYNKRHGIIDVEINAADKEDAAFPHSFAGKRVALTVSEDKSLLGGSRIKIGDYIIDASIKSKINAIRI
ncbi:MAG: F0F1 ATP synthase subunit delta [Patescibacteria group bacterium]